MTFHLETACSRAVWIVALRSSKRRGNTSPEVRTACCSSGRFEKAVFQRLLDVADLTVSGLMGRCDDWVSHTVDHDQDLPFQLDGFLLQSCTVRRLESLQASMCEEQVVAVEVEFSREEVESRLKR